MTGSSQTGLQHPSPGAHYFRNVALGDTTWDVLAPSQPNLNDSPQNVISVLDNSVVYIKNLRLDAATTAQREFVFSFFDHDDATKASSGREIHTRLTEPRSGCWRGEDTSRTASYDWEYEHDFTSIGATLASVDRHQVWKILHSTALKAYRTLTRKERLVGLTDIESGRLTEVRRQLNRLDSENPRARHWQRSFDAIERELDGLRYEISQL
jgi:hypothetical protein